MRLTDPGAPAHAQRLMAETARWLIDNSDRSGLVKALAQAIYPSWATLEHAEAVRTFDANVIAEALRDHRVLGPAYADPTVGREAWALAAEVAELIRQAIHVVMLAEKNARPIHEIASEHEVPLEILRRLGWIADTQ